MGECSDLKALVPFQCGVDWAVMGEELALARNVLITRIGHLERRPWIESTLKSAVSVVILLRCASSNRSSAHRMFFAGLPLTFSDYSFGQATSEGAGFPVSTASMLSRASIPISVRVSIVALPI